MHASTSGQDIGKAWGDASLRGVEGDILPSFTPDFATLDEPGIRHDVRMAERHGFFAVFCGAPIIDAAEYRRMIDIVCAEARGRMLVSVVAADPDVNANIDLLRHARAAGCSHAMVILRQGAASEPELVAAYRRMIEATDIGIILYAYASPAFKHLHPTGIPLGVYDKLADLPNVIGVKLTQSMTPAMAMACCERLAGRLQIDTADLDMLMVLAKSYPIRWTGQWLVEAMQSPDQRNVVELIELITRNDMQKAYDLFWKIQPAYRAFADLQRPFLLRGSHPWTHMKYHQWCVGGNGGLLRPDSERTPLDAKGRDAIKASYRAIGIDPSADPDDCFIVGRAAYGAGLRRSDMKDLPAYL